MVSCTRFEQQFWDVPLDTEHDILCVVPPLQQTFCWLAMMCCLYWHAEQSVEMDGVLTLGT